jgi:hypothetical protein
VTVLLLLGAFCAALGIWALSTHTKGLHISIRASIITLASLGFYMIWYSLASQYPVVTDSELHIRKVDQEKIQVSIVVDNIRDCRFESMDAYAVDSFGYASRAVWYNQSDLDPSVPKAKGLNDLGEISVILPNRKITQVYFLAHHTCPFGFQVETKFGQINLE